MTTVSTDTPEIQLHRGDCLKIMPTLRAGSIDLVLCDLPYGTTQNKWDSVIPLEPLWAGYWRLLKPLGSAVLTAQCPFDKVLGASCLDYLKYEWVWRKSTITGVLNAKIMPVRCHENVLVFCRSKGAYNPQGLEPKGTVTRQGGNSNNYRARASEAYVQEWTNWPRDVLDVKSERGLHPTQKPVALMEYMIRTYTNEGDTVLDNTMGSGTTGVACANTGRKFIGIEQDEKYFEIAKRRIEDARAARRETLGVFA